MNLEEFTLITWAIVYKAPRLQKTYCSDALEKLITTVL